MTYAIHIAVAEALIQESMLNTDSREQLLQGKDAGTYPLAVAPTPFASPSLLDRAQNKPDVEGHLRQLMKQRLKEETKTVYIPPQAKAGLHASDNARFQLMDKVREFITNDQKVFLLLGDSGAGKSTFIRALECDLWQAYKKGGLIPLHINLPAIDKPDQDMIAKHLRKSEFTESQIRELKEHRKFILICDGYDESQQTHNLYTTNRLNQPGEWQAKMLISCRSEYIGADYRDRFQPGDRNLTSETTLFQEAVITPFSVDQVEAYINKYVSIRQPLWEAREYKRALDHVPSLKKLVRNPFLMSLSLEVLPRMMDPGEGHSATRITKVALYDQFVEHWLERGKKRLGEKELSPQARAAFESLSDEGFTKNGIDFLKKLAVAIYKEQDGQPIVEYSRYKDETSWKAEFFNREDRQLLREACPLTRTGNQHRFIHRSLLEYGLARAIFDPQEWKETVISQPALGRRGSTSSAWSFEDSDADEISPSDVEQEPDINSPLVWRDFVNDPSLLQFMEERVQQEHVFKQQLLKYIEYSKRDKKWRRAAANAITILIRAGVEFRFADLQGIQVPGADLRYGVFDSANLQGADLRKANLRNIWLRGADLSKSHMAGVQFGELPILKHDCEMRVCTYSPDGSSFAIGLDDGTVIVYATSTWERLWTFNDHSKRITGIAYSPNGARLVSGSHDSTVRLWDVSTGECRQIFTGHSDQVFDVAYSPRGDLVASSSHDGAVRLWDVETGACQHILTGYDRYINHVAFSPKGDNIATSSWDFKVRLWDVATGKCRSILSGHTEWITSIAYSPNGDLVASGGRDRVVRIWVVETGKCRHVLHGYGLADIVFSPKGNQIAFCENGGVSLWDVETGICIRRLSRPKTTVYRVAYSPQGDQIVSSCSGEAVRLWDVETGECRHTMTGHTSFVTKVQYSPKGDCIATVSWDGTVRLWDVGSGTSRKISNDHHDSVLNIKHSPKRSQIASCSEDSTIRLWDAKTGVCCRTLTGHSGFVYKISYSPQEDRLVSCSEDKTVRIWDVESGACQRIFSGHTGNVSDVKFSPQGNQIVSSSQDMTVRLWNVETGECRRIFAGHSGAVLVVTYSPQGHQVASGSWDMTMRLWDAETGACQHVLTGHTKDVKRITYSPDGSQIASASEDTTVRLWDVNAGVCSHIFIGHQKTVTRVVYSPQGTQIASASVDNTIRLWDVESGECCHTLIGHKKLIAAIAYSPRGNLFVSWADFGEARLWDVKTGACRWTLEYDTVTTKSVYSFLQHNAVWISSDTDSFITGGRDGSVRVWDVVEEGDQCQVLMRWRSTNGRLTARDACIQDVEGLSHLNQRLLKQRGAIGESALHLREAGNKLNTKGPVVSQFKSSLS
jgi:WD40 repeat protein